MGTGVVLCIIKAEPVTGVHKPAGADGKHEENLEVRTSP